MSFVPRGTRAAARPLRQSHQTFLLRQSTRRRNASSHEGAGHGESAHHAEVGGTGNEGFGKGFLITLAAIPALYLTYQLSTTADDGNVISRFYRGYQAELAKKEAQDVLHTRALEQAIADKAIFYSEKADHHRDLRYTEFFNQGSPWNVAAGEGTANLSKLAEHYEEQRKKLDSEREQRMAARAKQ